MNSIKINIVTIYIQYIQVVSVVVVVVLKLSLSCKIFYRVVEMITKIQNFTYYIIIYSETYGKAFNILPVCSGQKRGHFMHNVIDACSKNMKAAYT